MTGTSATETRTALPKGSCPSVFLACRPIDLRAGFDGLAAKVQQIIGADPFSGHVFIFRSKRGHYLKGLYWDGSGLCLFAKRLERLSLSGHRSSTAH